MEDGLKISELNQASTINDSDLIPIVQNNETKSITKEDLMADTKALIDRNSTYSTTEQVVGTWIDGKPIYRKVIDIGSLPNASSKTISTGLIFNSSNCILKNMYGSANYSNGIGFCLPYFSVSGAEFGIALNIDSSNNLIITTGSDRSSMTGEVVIEYIKATD